MTHTNSTSEQAGTLHPTQTLEAAKDAAAILQQPPITLAEHELQSVYVDFGPGVVLGLDNAGCFSMHALERGGRPSVVLTRDETQALYRFWVPICGELIMQRIKEAVAERQAEREREEQARVEVVTILEERKQARRQQRVIDIAVAPDCVPDTLSYPPRIVTAPDGSQRLQLHGNDGWKDEGVVEEVTRLGAHGGLVLVATDSTVYLMTAQDFDHPIE